MNTKFSSLIGLLFKSCITLQLCNNRNVCQLNSTAERLDREDISTVTLLNDINTTLSLKVPEFGGLSYFKQTFNLP